MPSPLTSLTASLQIGLKWDASQDIPGTPGSQTAGDVYPSTGPSWTFGTGAGQINAALYGYGVLAKSGIAVIDLSNVQVPYLLANLNQGFSFNLVKYVQIELLPNPDVSAPSSGIQTGGYGTGGWDGWWSSGGSITIDTNGVPYIAGSDAGKTVDVATHRYLQITNLDAQNSATIRITILGVVN